MLKVKNMTRYDIIQSMKQWYSAILFVVLFFFMLACNSGNKHSGYTITGKINGAENGLVKIVQTDLMGKPQKIIDSTQMLNGVFKFKNKIEHPDLYTINLGKQGNINLYLENSKIHIEASLIEKRDRFSPINATIKGSSLQDRFEAYQKEIDSIRNSQEYAELDRLNKAYNTAAREGKTEEATKLYKALEKLKHLGKKRADQVKQQQMKFIKNNGSLPIATNIMEIGFKTSRLSFDEMTKIINLFQGDAKQTRAYRVIAEQYAKIKQTQNGEKAPSFTLETNEGNALSLNDISRKYILLDFWASWCKPCRASIPHLKKNYEKYKSAGFEVLAISIDESHGNWKKAITEDQTDWIHVIDSRGIGSRESDVAKLYVVPFIPTTFLLDKEGTILAKNLKTDELDKKLEELFGY